MNALDALNLGRQHGVSPSMLHTLLASFSNPLMTSTDIAIQIGVSTAAITGRVDRLMALGFVERVYSFTDRRSRHIVPTEKAFQLFQPLIEEGEA